MKSTGCAAKVLTAALVVAEACRQHPPGPPHPPPEPVAADADITVVVDGSGRNYQVFKDARDGAQSEFAGQFSEGAEYDLPLPPVH